MNRFSSLLLVTAIGLATGCGVSNPPGGGGGSPGKGDPLHGTWEGRDFERKMYMLYTFEPNGEFAMLEAPDGADPKGEKVRGTYTRSGSKLTVQVGGRTMSFSVKEVGEFLLVLVNSSGHELGFHRYG